MVRDGVVLCESVALSSSSLLFFSDQPLALLSSRHRVLFSFCFYGQSGSVFFWPTISFRHFFVDIFDKPCHLESNQQSSPVRVDSTRTFFVAVPFCCCCSLRRFHSDARQGTRGDFSISIGIVPLSLSLSTEDFYGTTSSFDSSLAAAAFSIGSSSSSRSSFHFSCLRRPLSLRHFTRTLWCKTKIDGINLARN